MKKLIKEWKNNTIKIVLGGDRNDKEEYKGLDGIVGYWGGPAWIKSEPIVTVDCVDKCGCVFEYALGEYSFIYIDPECPEHGCKQE